VVRRRRHGRRLLSDPDSRQLGRERGEHRHRTDRALPSGSAPGGAPRGEGSVHVTSREPPLQVDTEFPGGNAVIERVDADRIELRPDIRDTIGDWFYWCVRARGAVGRHLTVQVRRALGPAIGVRGPAVSTDGGCTWSWPAAGAVPGDEVPLTVPEGTGVLRLSFAVPPTAVELQRFLAADAQHPALERRLLTHARRGRRVELLGLGKVR